jgi:hypothetical protein
LQPRPDPRLRLVLTNLEHPSSDLNLSPDAPPGDERAPEDDPGLGIIADLANTEG